MPMIAYIEKNFHPNSRALIEHANAIIEEYQARGFTLTLRQLYYQFVARALIKNNLKSYKNLGAVINDARLAGLVDWDAIEDRTRNLMSIPSWDDPADMVEWSAKRYHLDRWNNQNKRLEVWIEKEALVGVVEGVCNKWDVPFFACRGYSSQSEQWRAGQRLASYIDEGQPVIVLHLGDHDPSGIDMTRDNESRLRTFISDSGGRGDFTIKRLALNMDQVRKHNPPPNPAKMTDSRAKGYIAEFGHSSWELDALDPETIAALIEKEITKHVDMKKLEATIDLERAGRNKLLEVAERLEDEQNNGEEE